jgi:4'-phosphopantetheinyl transferase EntD
MPSPGGLHFVARLLPECVAVVEGPLTDEPVLLWPEEAAYIANAVPKRRVEFACGRLFARRAMHKLGFGEVPIPGGADRAPIWPPGLTGSISHTDHYCAVAVARRSEISAIGVDVEDLDRFTLDLTRHVLSPREIAIELEGLPCQQRLERAAIIFSAKEALYKCLYPLTRMWIGFRDVEATLDAAGAKFDLRLGVPIGPFGAGECFAGRYAIEADRVATAVSLPSSLLHRGRELSADE